MGNECYGGWETDQHGRAFPGSPQDPYTYAQNFAVFRQKMLAVDPTIHLGALVITGQDSYGNGQHGVTNPVSGSFSATFPAYSMTVLDLVGPAAPYQTWQASHFTAAQLANPAVSGDLADPDGDGVVNLLEYALGLDPLSANRTGLPVVTTTSRVGTTNLALTYTKVKTATDLTYLVEVSADLVTWNSGSGYTADVAVLHQGTTEQVTTRDLTAISAATPYRFMRLRVTRD